MDLGLTGKTALVTGGAGGIGAAIVASLEAEGCRVAVVDRDISALSATAPQVLAFEADVRDFQRADEVVTATREETGRLDLLVCCAGVTADAVSWKMTEDDFDRVVGINLKGSFAYCRAVAPGFREQKSGRIVTISSINGMRGKFGQANYSASKGGVIAMSKTLARELGRSSVTVNVVAPGIVATPMVKSMPAEALETAIAETVLGRMASPADVANAVVFLCSDAAAHITGEVIRVDGGQYI